MSACAPVAAPPAELYAVSAVCNEESCEVTVQRASSSTPVTLTVPVSRSAATRQPALADSATSLVTDFYAYAACKAQNAFGEGRHPLRQQAMLIAAKACAADGGAPTCCTDSVIVSDVPK